MSLQIGRFGRSWSLQTLSTDNPKSWWSIGRGLDEPGEDSKCWEMLGETGVFFVKFRDVCNVLFLPQTKTQKNIYIHALYHALSSGIEWRLHYHPSSSHRIVSWQWIAFSSQLFGCGWLLPFFWVALAVSDCPGLLVSDFMECHAKLRILAGQAIDY